MVGIVQPDADELAGARDAGAKPGRRIDHGQRCGVDAAQPGKTFVRQGRTGNVGNYAREIPDGAVLVHKAGAFGPLWPVAKKFHAVSFQTFDQPPSITWATPVVYALSSEAR